MDPFIGQIQTLGFSFPPFGWMLCNGDLISIAENSALYALLGTTYGGDGINTFALPNLQGRSMIHQGTGPGLSPMVIGQMSGAESVTLLTQNLPTHAHGVTVSVKTTNGEEPVPTNNKLAAKSNAYAEDATSGAVLGGVIVNAVGGNTPIPIRNPYVGIYHSIAIQGIFPSRN